MTRIPVGNPGDIILVVHRLQDDDTTGAPLGTVMQYISGKEGTRGGGYVAERFHPMEQRMFRAIGNKRGHHGILQEAIKWIAAASILLLSACGSYVDVVGAGGAGGVANGGAGGQEWECIPNGQNSEVCVMQPK